MQADLLQNSSGQKALNYKEFWPLLLGGWAAVITVFSSPYYVQGAYYATQFLSYSYYAMCLTFILLWYRQRLNRRNNHYQASVFLSIGLSALSVSFVIIQSERIITWALSHSHMLNSLLQLDHHYRIISDGQWSRGAQLILFQVSWLAALVGVKQIKLAYRESLQFLGLTQNLHQALFRIRAGYVGEGFIADTLDCIAKSAQNHSEDAESMVENLGELVRYALETSQSAKVKLDLETRALGIYLELFDQVFTNTESASTESANPRCQINIVKPLQDSKVLPMSILGLVAHVLGHLSPALTAPNDWFITITLEQDEDRLQTRIIYHPGSEFLIERLAEDAAALDNAVLDSMRFRLEQAYPGGSYIELVHDKHLQILLTVPTIQ
ncbi:MAG: hypothetical protein COA42_06560 [Alteromonadaceae bacterium]|nr:MAG: hypothetical protein COA42_06560 [Alteromonadaceae bacterium]